MPDATLTTQQPGEKPQTRPVPPSWATVAPLLARWHMALVPHQDGTWDVLAGFDRQRGVHDARCLLFHELPQAIADLAARCEADAAAAGKEEA